MERADLRGFLHCHTNYSDGSNTVEELALACQAAGYQYLGITDHSQAAAYAGGLRPMISLRQADEIDEVNARTRRLPGAQGRSRPTSCRMAGWITRTAVLPGSTS